MKPTIEQFARLAIETLDAQQDFFRAKSGTADRLAALEIAKLKERQLRRMAADALKPATLFD